MGRGKNGSHLPSHSPETSIGFGSVKSSGGGEVVEDSKGSAGLRKIGQMNGWEIVKGSGGSFLYKLSKFKCS